MGAEQSKRWADTVRLGVCGLAFFFLAGCGDEVATRGRLKELEQAFAGGGASQDTSAEAARMVAEAIASVRTNGRSQSVMLLQSAQKLNQVTPDQRISIQMTIRAISAELVRKADQGDEHARRELKRIEAFLEQN